MMIDDSRLLAISSITAWRRQKRLIAGVQGGTKKKDRRHSPQNADRSLAVNRMNGIDLLH